jgi:hypothetical protein
MPRKKRQPEWEGFGSREETCDFAHLMKKIPGRLFAQMVNKSHLVTAEKRELMAAFEELHD